MQSLKPWTASLAHRAGVLILAAGLGAPGVAQQATLDDNIEQARNALTQLDALAADCLAAAGQDPARIASACQTFRQALDGDSLVTYLSACDTVRSWRDEFVTRRMETRDDATAAADQQNLQQLVRIDYWCGESALTRRTTNVVAAYRLIRESGSSTVADMGTVRSLQQQLDEAALQGLGNAEQSRRQDAFDSSRQRLQQETARLQNQLELELIRQQTVPNYAPR